MRPGLDKPGALPLLVLIVFSLLTLAPSLSSIYKFADLTYYYPGAQVPLIKDTVAELPSEAFAIDHRKSWIPAAQHRPRVNRPSRSSRSGHTVAPTVPGEITPVENRSRLSSVAAESTFMFSRRARAFRTYFVQQLDDYQFFTPFSNRTLPAQTMNFFPTPASPYRSPSPTSIDHNKPDHIPSSNDNETTSSYTTAGDSGLQFPLHHAWQQVCHSASGVWELTKESPYTYALLAWVQSCSQYVGSIFAPEDTAAALGHDKGISTTPGQNPSLPETQTLVTVTNDQTTDAAGRHTSELRGSCMAVVIGLVVGIMWF